MKRKILCAVINGIQSTIETVAKFLFIILPSVCVMYIYTTHSSPQNIFELIFIYFVYVIFIYRKYIIKDQKILTYPKNFQFLLFNIFFSSVIFPIILEISGTRETVNDWIGFILVAVMGVTAIKQKGVNNLSPWEGEAFYQSFTNTILSTWLVYLAYQCYVLRETGFYVIIPIFIGIVAYTTIRKNIVS